VGRKWGEGCILWRKRQYFEINLGEDRANKSGIGTTLCVLNRVERSKNIKSMLKGENPGVLRQKSLYFECHSGLDPACPVLDPESNDFNWIPAQASPRRAFAGMTASELT